jgi:hypothetical protein
MQQMLLASSARGGRAVEVRIFTDRRNEAIESTVGKAARS